MNCLSIQELKCPHPLSRSPLFHKVRLQMGILIRLPPGFWDNVTVMIPGIRCPMETKCVGWGTREREGRGLGAGGGGCFICQWEACISHQLTPPPTNQACLISVDLNFDLGSRKLGWWQFYPMILKNYHLQFEPFFLVSEYLLNTILSWETESKIYCRSCIWHGRIMLYFQIEMIQKV